MAGVKLRWVDGVKVAHSRQQVNQILLLRSKDRFCDTKATVALIDTSIPSD